MSRKKQSEKTAVREKFRDDLRARIYERKGDVEDAARDLGVAKSTVSRWINQDGDKFPDVWQLFVLATARQISAAWLAYGLGPKHQDEAWEQTPRPIPPEAEEALALYLKLPKRTQNLVVSMMKQFEGAPAPSAVQEAVDELRGLRDKIMHPSAGARADSPARSSSGPVVPAEDVEILRRVVRLLEILPAKHPLFEPLDQAGRQLSASIEGGAPTPTPAAPASEKKTGKSTPASKPKYEPGPSVHHRSRE
ncbi:MAG: helix-turn-helix domain-containing protein [Planctomycetes bacterium]|nr:helix-turn-helix domain-containing protein [Planctomycetota bacterium]